MAVRQQFRFLDLPPEVRQRVYVLICRSPEYISLDTPDAHSSFPLELLLTNHQIYQEVRPVYFSTNAFSLTINRRNDHWDYILHPSWQDNRRQLRKLRITVLRWGSKNFFSETLIPVLEDCVLNGHLIHLDVRVKGNHLLNTTTEGSSCPEILKTHQPVQLLKRLCDDPYLQHVRLTAYWDVDFDACIMKEPLEHSLQDVTWLIDR